MWWFGGFAAFSHGKECFVLHNGGLIPTLHMLMWNECKLCCWFSFWHQMHVPIQMPVLGEKLNLYRILLYSLRQCHPSVLGSQLTVTSSQKPGCSCILCYGVPSWAVICCMGTLSSLLFSLLAGYILVCFQLRCTIWDTIWLPESGKVIIYVMPQLPASSQQLTLHKYTERLQ